MVVLDKNRRTSGLLPRPPPREASNLQLDCLIFISFEVRIHYEDFEDKQSIQEYQIHLIAKGDSTVLEY